MNTITRTAIFIPTDVRDELLSIASRRAPEAAFGVLLGRRRGTLAEVISFRDLSGKNVKNLSDLEGTSDFAEIETQAREDRLEIVGVWNSSTEEAEHTLASLFAALGAHSYIRMEREGERWNLSSHRLEEDHLESEDVMVP